MRKPMPFGKYLLLDRIAVGGMAEVFAAKSFGVEGFERVVAIKRILPTMVEDDEFISMFIDEARIASMLNHANIVQIYELGKHDDTFFIAMEYVSGRDVRMLIDKYKKRGQAMPVDLACYIVAKVAEGLDYAHRKKDQAGRDLAIIHRDISPQNVLVSYEGEVKIIDLGIAKAAGRLQKTQAGILKGKFGYMSPEQVRGIPIDHRSDIYSAGVMLYEMLTGTKLFTGESDFSTLEKVRAGEVRPPSELNPAIVPALEAVVLKALAKDRDQRYQWAGELSDSLLHYLFSSSSSVFSNSKLAGFMRDTFADELRKEGERIRRWADSTPESMPEPAGVATHGTPAGGLVPVATSTGPDGKVRIGPPSAFMTSELRLQDRTNVVGTPFKEEAPAPRGYGARRPPPPPVNEAVTEAASLADLGMAFNPDAPPDVADKPTQVKSAPPPPRKNSKIQKGLGSQGVSPPPFSGDETMPPDFVDAAAAINGASVSPAADREPLEPEEPSRPIDIAHPTPSKAPLAIALVAVLVVLALAAFLFSDELARLRGPSTGSLLVAVTPAKGIEILIDGSLVGTASPVSARLPFGEHKVEVKGEGYRAWSGTVEVAAKSVAMPPITLEAVPPPPPPEPEPEPEPAPVPTKESRRNRNTRTTTTTPAPAPTRTTRTPAVTAPAPEPEETAGNGALMVFSSPKGARLFVNGRSRGQTPLKVTDLPTSRDVELRLELDGYKTQSRAERAAEGTPRMVKFELQPEETSAPAPPPPVAAAKAAPVEAGGTVRVIGLCRPASQVHVDGKPTGRSSPIFPQKPLELSPGRHVIACVAADGKRKEQSIELTAGQPPFKFDISLAE